MDTREQLDVAWTQGCNTTCDHGGICTLDWDHDGLHSASGYCEWERTEDDCHETVEECIDNTLISLKKLGGLL